MSQQNKQIDRRFYKEVWNEGNYALVDQVTAADYIGYTPPDQEPVDREGVKRNIAILRQAFPDIHFTIDDQIAEGDRVVTRWTANGTHQGQFEGLPPTGRQACVTGVTISRIAAGKYVEGWTSWDALGLIEQLTSDPQ